MNHGKGRPIKQESKRQASVRAIPLWGQKLHQKLWKPQALTNDNAPNQFSLVTGSAGSGKTNLARLWIDELIANEQGFEVTSAHRDIINHAIGRMAEKGWPAEKFVLVDFFNPLGHPVIDFFEDDPDDEISPFQLTEEFVSATALVSADRSIAGARQLDLTRMAVLPNILQGRTLADLGMFLTDPVHRTGLVNLTGHPALIRFWCGKNAYFNQLPKDSLESLRNKWNPLFLHPYVRRVIDKKGSSFDRFWFLQNGGVIINDLSENKFKPEIRQTIAQMLQYASRVNVLKRQETDHRPFYMHIYDEFIQYKTITTIDLTRIARQLNVGCLFLLQDLGLLNQEEYRALTTNCGSIMAMNCSKNDATDMAHELFLYSDAAYRDWDESKTYSLQEQQQAWISLIMQLHPGQMIARVKPGREAWLLDVPQAEDPKVSVKTMQAFLKDMAAQYYRTPSR